MADEEFIAEIERRLAVFTKVSFDHVAVERLLKMLKTATPMTPEQYRDVGYTKIAAQFPMEALPLAMFSAFNGVTPDRLPEAMHYHPNAWSQKAWTRAADVAVAWVREQGRKRH